ncbi:MAG: hydrogenase maturation nickel metallochaperone HypA [Candidatus Riflemargulisbacteria bacterium]
MHELSLAMELVELARREAGKHGASAVSEIQMAIGDLSGVEADAFQAALEFSNDKQLLEYVKKYDELNIAIQKKKTEEERIFESVTIRAADIIAPSSISIGADSLKLGKRFAKAFFIFS